MMNTFLATSNGHILEEMPIYKDYIPPEFYKGNKS